MEITFNYVDRSLNLRGVLSTKNMNYRGNIQKLINDDSYIKKWRNFLNFVFNRLKNQNKITKSTPDIFLNYHKGQVHELLKLPQISEVPKLPQIPEVPKLPQELETR